MLLEVLLTLSKYLSFLSSFAFVGLLLAMSLLTVNTEGNFSANSLALRRKASLIGLIWFFSSFSYIIATLADILGVSFTDALDITTVRSFVSQILIGRYLLAQTLAAFIVGYLILRPSAITITTEFPLIEEGNEIVVTDPNGKRVDTGILTVLGTDAVAEMKPLETSGLYKVTYLLLAEADIPLEGSYTFTYSAVVISTPSASATPQPSASATSEPVGSNFGTNLFVIFLLGLSILVLIGMGAYARKIFKEK